MTPTADIIRIGNEGQPILIVDDFFPLTDKLLVDAGKREYRKIGPYYPGIRSDVPSSYLKYLLGSLSKLIRSTFDYDTEPRVEEAMYSLVTTEPQDLMPIQLFPHYDGVDGSKLAVLHYLCGPEFGGTDFYRHRSTGYETVTEDRFEHFKQTFEQEVQAVGMPEQRYINGSTELFEHVFRIEARFNRVVVYRGINLHSASVPNDISLPDDPGRGRLTVNTFLNR